MRFLAVLFLVPVLSAQSLRISELIQGQRATFEVVGATPGAQVVHLISTQGLGSGACFPPPINLCLDIRSPFDVLAVVPVNAAGVASLEFGLPGDLPTVAIACQALVVSLGGVTKTLALERTIQTIASLSDDFAGNSLDPRWRIHNPGMLSYSVASGALHMVPTQAGPGASWYADGEGPLVYQLVTGDFTVTSIVRAGRVSNPGQPPAPEYRLGGITVRDPASSPGQRNWVHLTTGAGTAAVPLAVEDKTTVNSTSSLILYPIPQPRVELRVVRRGQSLAMAWREVGAATWQPLRTFVRPDLPATVQVGLNLGSWQAPPDLQLSVEEIRFAR